MDSETHFGHYWRYEHFGRSRGEIAVDVWGIVQLVVNGGALLGGAAVWKTYVESLREGQRTKDSEIALLKTDRDIWKDKVRQLEERSPEVMEQVLGRRIELREAEIIRMGEDQQKNQAELDKALREKSDLQSDLARTKGFRRVLELEGDDDEDRKTLDELLGPEREIEIVEIGQVGVDSGMLMLTDPCYIDSEWSLEPWALGSRYDDSARGKTYVQDEDFVRFDEKLRDYGKTPTQLIEEGVWVKQQDVEIPPNYSYNGAASVTLRRGYGELNYRKGHSGAGVVFSTTFGDGGYIVYGELRNGQLVRVYLNLT
ncbi:hypothetical protein [Demequina capsici]|uniref:Uncharacterized protein n=1 Tax=Demequina capsici TaxID=3075620 RepID=A0AA96F759_9MICO|nr:hypothetical protein [Demequina sp. OYTSA14]WNM24383.1 hypothetical protein RN606_13615 [Demequina sp. OYTSA14]